jgi:hypothetical protein
MDSMSNEERKPVGAYMAELEGRGAGKVEINRLRKAEAKAGIQTGVRFLSGREGIVSFLGYPKPRFFFQYLDRATMTYSDPVVIDKETFDQTKTLAL